MEDIKLLKHTIRGLNYRYSALKKINTLIGESRDVADFHDKVLGMIVEMMCAEAGLIFIKERVDTVKIEVLRASLPSKKEEKIKKEIEGMEISVKDLALKDKKNIAINDTPDMTLNYRMLIEKALGKVTNSVIVPINIKNKVAGAIELYNIMGSMGEDKKESLISIANQVGVPMELFERLTTLEERTSALQELTSITEAITSPHQLETVLDMIVRNSISFFSADGCSILLKNKEGKPEFVMVSGEKSSILKGEELAEGEGVVGWVIEGEKPVLIEKVENDPRFSPRIDNVTQMATGSIICVPLKVINEIIGVIEIVRSVDREPFKEEEMDLLMVLASHASIAIDKTRLYTQKDLWFKSTVELLSKTVDTKDRFFPNHTQMVRKYVKLLGEQIKLDSQELELLDLVAAVQDIGKLTIPDRILAKQDKLSQKELDEIRDLPLRSVHILETVEEFKEIVPIIKSHHERYDGTGYPEHLSGEAIPKLARILAITEAYSAMIGRRPYRNALSKDVAKKRLSEQAGKQFEPQLVKAFILALDKESK